jgi:hypothetical protein
MSLAQAYLDRLLKLDVESYLRGKMPSRLALAEASHLENWRVELACQATVGSSSILFNAAMVITGGAERSGGASVTTTPLVWLDRNGSWARTRDGLYRLGKRATSS